jgi:hypothetical protein
MTCDCSTYQDLNPNRESFRERVKASKQLRKFLVLKAKDTATGRKLLVCNACGQLWQEGSASNLAPDAYLFKVPKVDEQSWLEAAYAEPDKVFMHNFVINEFVKQSHQAETTQPCKEAGCTKRALKLSVFCLTHHVQSLQRANRLPSPPAGRLFGNLTLFSP